MDLLRELIESHDVPAHAWSSFSREKKQDTPAEAKVRQSAIDTMRKMGVPSRETDKLKKCSIAEVERQMTLFKNHIAAFRGK